MKFVIGGAWQGKKEWVLQKEGRELQFADGAASSYEAAETSEGITDFHHYIRRLAVEGKTEEEILSFLGGILEKNPEVIIIMDEIGQGVTPIDGFERHYRELSGRAGQFLAKRAKEVYRITAGIGQRIK
ncbi:bifunctional adenosylcobinamide kinase/adenosylcobinamide-phosphate guanylyltransferase [Lachnospiraceae bacterium 62-35]